MNKMGFIGRAAAKVVKALERGKGGSALGVGGTFRIEHYGADGKLKGIHFAKNGVTQVGRDSILDVYFHSATQITTWYMGLIDAYTYTGVAAGEIGRAHV